MTRLSVLDLAPITQGSDAAAAFRNSLDFARHAERLGFYRYWLAEHHNMPGIASAATSIVIAHVAAGTKTIRVGAGGIMLPNHAPLVVAEQFGTLESLFPGRIDLGLGRAPGTDMVTAHALRRTLASDPDAFPQDVLELMGYFAGLGDHGVHAVPGAGLRVPIYILGSSTFGAQVAAALGLPFAFASHFAAQMLLLSVTFVCIAVTVDFGWAVAAGWARRFLATRMRLTNRISGGLLITAGIGLAVARNK